MKNIDPKSLIIGVLATVFVFACTDSNNKNSAPSSLIPEAKAATGRGDRWDDGVEWMIAAHHDLQQLGLMTKVGGTGTQYKITGGWEPCGSDLQYFRKRIK
jgi:hypothetical protein|tara:strand:+ start:566 stop:868 length:303 start_codon:yes stop_codon:yes gene_type:complete